MTHATVWMKLDDIELSGISHTRKDEYCVVPLIRALQKSDSWRWRQRVVAGAEGGRGGSLTGPEFRFRKMKEKVLELDGDDGYTTT